MPSIYEKKKSIYEGLEILDMPPAGFEPNVPTIIQPEKEEKISRPQFKTTPRDIRPPFAASPETPMTIGAAPPPKGHPWSGWIERTKPRDWKLWSPLEKFHWYLEPIGNVLDRIGGATAVELGLTKKEDVEQLWDADITQNLEWYQKVPEAVGWGAAKAAEYKTLSGIFKLTGLSSVLTRAGQKAAAPFITGELAKRGGLNALKTMSKAGLKSLGRQAITSFLKAAPENATFIASWSALDALQKGKPAKDIGKAAVAGAAWGTAITGVFATTAPLLRTPEIRLAFGRAMQRLQTKYPRLVDFLGKDVQQEILDHWMQEFGTVAGRDVRFVDLTKTQQARFKNMLRTVQKELIKRARAEQAAREYYAAGAAAKAAERVKTAELMKPKVKAKEVAKFRREAAEALEKVKPPPAIEKPPSKPIQPSEKAPPAAAKEVAKPPEAEAVPTVPPTGEVKAPTEGKIKVYHGTADVGDTVVLETGKKPTDAGAVFFTESKKYAKQYAKTPDQVSGLYETELDVSNVFDINNPQHIEKLIDNWYDPSEYDSKVAAVEDAKRAIDAMKETMQLGAVDWATGSQYLEEIERAGFEGVRFLERPGDTIEALPTGGFKVSGPPVYSYAMLGDKYTATKAKPTPAEPTAIAEVKAKVPEGEISRRPVTVEGKKYYPIALPTDQIGVDAAKFQFKLGAKLVGGVTEALKGVEKFDPVRGGQILVWQDKDGKYWVVDGHHRVALAKKTGAETLETWVVSEKDGVTEQDARAIGALRNLADGKGTAVDAAKLFRDSDISLNELRKNAVPTESTVVQQGLDMADLSDEVFRLVIDERLPANMAATIGKQVKNPTQQKQVADLILEGEVETLRQAELLAATIDSAPVLTKTEQTLFGLETTEKSLYAERAKVLANVEKKLKTNKKVFGVLATQTGIIEAKGNILAKVENLATKEKAEEVLFMLEKLANTKGPVAEALNDATKQYAENPTKENLSKVTTELLEKWTEGPGRLRIPVREGVPELPLERVKPKVEETTIKTSVGDIQIPTEELDVKWDKALEVIFDYGNQTAAGKPIQPDLVRSLSMGDTVEYEGKTWLVMPRGWQDVSYLSAEQIDKLVGEAKIPKPPKPKGKPGFIDVRPLEKSLTTFLKTVEPAKIAQRAFGKKPNAIIIKGIHQADVGRIEFNEAEIEALDSSLVEFGEKLSRYSDKILKNLMAARGKPVGKGAVLLKREALIELAKKAPELVGVRKIITQIGDHNYKYLQSVVGDDIHYVEDYFYGIYKDTKDATVENFLDYWHTTDRFTKQKKLPTVADAIAYGLELRDYNPVNNLRSEYMAIARLDGMIYMRDELMRTGKGRYIDMKEEAPHDWEKIKEPVFKDVRVHPELAVMIKSLLSTNKLRRHWALRGLTHTNNALRTLKFMFSMFHQLNIAKQTVADSGYLGFLQPQKWVGIHKRPGKKIPIGLHKETVLKGLTTGFKKNDPIFRTPFYKRYIKNGGGHRYSIASQAARAFSNSVESLDKRLGFAFKLGALPIRIPKAYVKWLFQSYIPKVKYSKTLDVYNEKVQKLGRELTDVEFQEIIKEGQNFYGMMNERLFGRSGTVTSLMRLWYMSPGYFEGNLRSELKSILQWGGKDGFKANRSRSNIINSLLLSGIIATITTLIMTGKLPKKPETLEGVRDLFKGDTGKKDDKGRKIMVDFLTYDKDYWNLFGNVLTGQPDEAAKAVLKRTAGMVAPSAQVAVDIANMAAGRALVDWKNDRVTEVTDPFAKKVLKIAIHEIKRIEPISVSVYGQSRRRDQTRVLSALTSLLGYRPTLTEKDRREQQVLHRIYSLKGQQEELYQYLAGIRNPRKAVERYNKTVDTILSSPMISQSMRREWEPKLVIDLDRYLENRVYYLSQQNRTEKEITRAKKILKNFGITPTQAQEYLDKYWARERKIAPVSPLERDRVIGRTRKRKRLTERMAE